MKILWNGGGMQELFREIKGGERGRERERKKSERKQRRITAETGMIIEQSSYG